MCIVQTPDKNQTIRNFQINWGCVYISVSGEAMTTVQTNEQTN